MLINITGSSNELMLCTYLIRRRNTRVTEATASSPTHSHRINTDRNFTQCKRATIHTADTLVGVANWLREWCQVCRACTHAQYTSNQYHLARVVSCRVVSCRVVSCRVAYQSMLHMGFAMASRVGKSGHTWAATLVGHQDHGNQYRHRQ
jgi:hypothetical protein